MEITQLPGLALIWLVAVAAPGPDMVLVLQQSIARSRRAGLLAALGITTGATIWLIGALFGLAGGVVLHRFVILTVEVDAVMFGRDIEPLSFACALALTFVFSLMVNLVMGRKLKHISMVESMKAPE